MLNLIKPDHVLLFWVVTGGQAYAIDAFKPTNCPGNDWVVVSVVQKQMSMAWNV